MSLHPSPPAFGPILAAVLALAAHTLPAADADDHPATTAMPPVAAVVSNGVAATLTPEAERLRIQAQQLSLMAARLQHVAATNPAAVSAAQVRRLEHKASTLAAEAREQGRDDAAGHLEDAHDDLSKARVRTTAPAAPLRAARQDASQAATSLKVTTP